MHVIGSGDKTQVTVLVCCSASGYTLPPMVIYKRKNLTPELRTGEIEGTLHGLSSTGWMDGELFQEWFHHHFLEYVPATRPIILLLDGHSSHYRLEVIREASIQGVIVFVLPPNTTHLCQPLDVSPFNSFKVYWDQVCDTFMATHPGKIVTIHQFPSLFHQAWQKAMVPATVTARFKKVRVFPLNRKAIIIPGEIPCTSNTPTAVLARREGIRFMPFMSSTEKKQLKKDPHTNNLEDTSGEEFEEPIFSQEEEARFGIQYENGYDLKHDARYNLWLKHHHLDVSTSSIVGELSFPSSNSSVSSDIGKPIARRFGWL